MYSLGLGTYRISAPCWSKGIASPPSSTPSTSSSASSASHSTMSTNASVVIAVLLPNSRAFFTPSTIRAGALPLFLRQRSQLSDDHVHLKTLGTVRGAASAKGASPDELRICHFCLAVHQDFPDELSRIHVRIAVSQKASGNALTACQTNPKVFPAWGDVQFAKRGLSRFHQLPWPLLTPDLLYSFPGSAWERFAGGSASNF